MTDNRPLQTSLKTALEILFFIVTLVALGWVLWDLINLQPL